MATSVRNVGELLALLQLDNSDTALQHEAAKDFPLRVPRHYIERMRKGDASDPLLLQILPSAQETEHQPADRNDPLDERRRQPVNGLVHKYRGRALWMLSGTCALHCRYCFRRQLPYSAMISGIRGADEVCDWLDGHPDIREVILSGGDPLSLPDPALSPLADRLDSIAHLDTLRIHTRLPVALPERVDEGLLGWLEPLQMQKVMVLHLNHPRELDPKVAKAVDLLRNAGVRLYAQSVLLAGVNDSADCLEQLFDRLWQTGVQPYYLHLLDPVRGAAHFDVAEWRAKLLYGELCSRMPGYRLPRMVRETPGLPAKSLVPPVFAATELVQPER